MVSQLCVRFTSKRWFLNMIHLMPCWYTCRFCIHLAFIYYVGPSNVVWNKFGMVLSSPPLKMLKVQWSQTLCMKWFLSYEERLCFFFFIFQSYANVYRFVSWRWVPTPIILHQNISLEIIKCLWTYFSKKFPSTWNPTPSIGVYQRSWCKDFDLMVYNSKHSCQLCFGWDSWQRCVIHVNL